jgi:FkbM family methyltransferase
LRKRDTAIDVGANCGFYTSLFWSIVKPSGRVLAFEPNPSQFRRLTEWFHNNRVSNVEFFPAALGDEETIATLFVHPAKDWRNNATLTPVDDGWNEVEVKVLRLEELLAKQKITRVRLMKVDVEGFEGKVLKGAENLLAAGTFEYILIEFNDYWLSQNGSSSGQLMRYCQSLGLEIAKGRPPSPGGLSNVLLKHRGRS